VLIREKKKRDRDLRNRVHVFRTLSP
jgi:hypothetical protein